LTTILIPKALVAELQADRAAYLPNETGGYLLGQRWVGDIEILSATRQGPGDVATPYSFEREDDESHHRVALDQWKKDGGKTGYMGDWHSHPTGDDAPSEIDRKAWSALQEHARGPVVGIIVGETRHLRVFRCFKTFGLMRVTECSLVSEDDSHFCYGPKGFDASNMSRCIKI
jgi:integrative and conjugative element protein (TIGR02256 family)